MLVATLGLLFSAPTQDAVSISLRPTRTEVVTPIHTDTFDKGGKAKVRKQGGNPRFVDGVLVFDGSTDGNRQVDPQIAVGGGFVFHGTNSGLVIYDKKGNWQAGVPQSEFNDGIDPKLFFDPNNRVFGFDLWNPWDKAEKKPVNISISETSNPLKAWNTYPVPAPKGVDGGGIGFSRKWVGYSFPGGPEQTFVLRLADLKKGKPATVYHFAGSLGHPVATQDRTDDLHFVQLTDQEIVITRVSEARDGTPVVASVKRKAHAWKYFGWPPASPMKGVTQRTASGDRNPKNLVIQSGYLWFSHAVNVTGSAAVQWHQVQLDGTIVQSGLLSHPTNSYIQTTLAVNKKNDVLIGFQETGPGMFISGRCAYRLADDPLGSIRRVLKLGEGVAATEGGAWGDYSGSVVDGDNLTDLWTIQSVANEKGRGNTVIARIPVREKPFAP